MNTLYQKKIIGMFEASHLLKSHIPYYISLSKH